MQCGRCARKRESPQPTDGEGIGALRTGETGTSLWPGKQPREGLFVTGLPGVFLDGVRYPPSKVGILIRGALLCH